MGHELSAIVARGPGNAVAARRLGLTLVGAGAFVIVPLPEAGEGSAPGGPDHRRLSDLRADCPLTLRAAAELGFDRFALIQSALVGGLGTQWATVYHGLERTMPAREGMAAINDALERIGVLPDAGRDAFATIGLGGMRHADLFLDRGRAATG
ncbi:MAG: hypothetical protein LCH92_11665 [Proteobacteria bacterium]|nr:hypothetical protein [Pseudomonadota bacterium]